MLFGEFTTDEQYRELKEMEKRETFQAALLFCTLTGLKDEDVELVEKFNEHFKDRIVGMSAVSMIALEVAKQLKEVNGGEELLERFAELMVSAIMSVKED